MSGPGYMARVRKCYGVPAKRGMRVVVQAGPFDQHSGRILSAMPDARLRVRVYGPTKQHNRTCIYHPWDLKYQPEGAPLGCVRPLEPRKRTEG